MTVEFIDAKQLVKSLGQHLTIDCRFSLADFSAGDRQYAEGHIPGAQRLDMERDLAGPKGAHGGRHPLPGAEQFQASLRRCGVNSDSSIVLYDNNRMAGCARASWLLQHYGHSNIKILDGGISAWLAAGGALSTEITPVAKGNFTASQGTGRIVERNWLLAHCQDENLQLVDSRELPRYLGETEPMDPVAGHIPGAICLPWMETSEENGKLKDDRFQNLRLSQLDRDKLTVVYCGSGVTASVNLLIMAKMGFRNLALYPGSWSDWCSYSDSPIATGTDN